MVTELPTAAGWNQTSWPAPLMIIAPFWPRPELVVRKMSPGAAAGELVVIDTDGGCSFGCVTNDWVAPACAFGGGRLAETG